MKHLQLLLQAIKNEPTEKNVIPKLPILLEKINDLLLNIKNCESFQAASHYFDVLQEIEEVLAGLLFKEGIDISRELIKFVRDCDRLDNIDLRKYLFNKLKQDQYSLKDDEFIF